MHTLKKKLLLTCLGATAGIIIFFTFLSNRASCNGNVIKPMKDVTYRLTNSDFEKGAISSKGTIDGWDNIGASGLPVADRTASYHWDNATSHSGNGSAKIMKTLPGGMAALIQDIPGLESGKWFQASAWIKTEGIQTPQGIDIHDGGASISIVFFMKDTGNPIIFETPMVQKDWNWHEERIVFVVPNNVDRAAIVLGLRSLRGGAWFDDISVSQVSNLDAAKEEPFSNFDTFGGCKQVQGKKTGYFHVEKLDNRWWIIDPEGYGFIVMGISDVKIEQFGTELYKENLKKFYKNKEDWLKITVKRLKEWGFNTVSRGEDELASIFVYDTGIGQRSAAKFPLFPPFPDVFDKRFQESLDREAMDVTKTCKNDPRLLGYITANELPWYGIPGKDFFDIVFTLPPEKPGKQALVEFLKQRYSDQVKSFNKIWNTNINSFRELLEIRTLKVDPLNKGKIIEDKSSFLRLVAKTYFRMHHNAIKKYDPNHMILGVRFIGANAPKEVLEEMAPYVDIVSFQPYTPIAPIELLEKTYSIHGKPILVTEFGFAANDSGLPNTKGPGIVLKDQQNRYLWYKRYISRLLSSPIMVGWIWWQYVDEPSTGRIPDGENSNYGLVNMDDQPYFDLVNGMKEIHSQIYPHILKTVK